MRTLHHDLNIGVLYHRRRPFNPVNISVAVCIPLLNATLIYVLRNKGKTLRPLIISQKAQTTRPAILSLGFNRTLSNLQDW